jgi:hypothetical protein
MPELLSPGPGIPRIISAMVRLDATIIFASSEKDIPHPLSEKDDHER